MNQAIREPIEHTTGETMPAATRRRRTWLLGGLAGAIALAALLAWWWSSGRFLEGTDDAYVRADWVAVSAQVSGYVAEVLVADDADVQAGDLLVSSHVSFLREGESVVLASAQSTAGMEQ